MGFRISCTGETVIVVMDANRNRENLAALNWALKNIVRPKDTVIVLGILCEVLKKSSCFPFYIWERLEFSTQGDMTPKVLEEEIVKKREEYQAALQPFYQQCKRNEIKLEVKLAAGFSPKIITIEEAQNTNTRWIVLDSHLKKDRVDIYGHVECNIAVMKTKNVATIMPNQNRKPTMKIDQAATAVQPENPQHDMINASQEEPITSSPSSPIISPPSSPCWCPLSWRPGFPRNFTVAEIKSITNDFAHENILFAEGNVQLYQGIFMESPILIKCFLDSDECFWSQLKILAKVRHRNILNLIGYCCADASMFLLQDFPCNGSLDKHLECDELAKKLSWKARWDIALGIGICLRYLQEECLYGPIVNLAICSSCVVLSHNFSPLLANFSSAKWLGDDGESDATSSVEKPSNYTNMLENGRLSLDVHSFGVFLLELITGQNGLSFDFGQVLEDQVLHFLESGSFSQVMDQRLPYSSDAKEVRYMSSAALLCVKNDSGYRPSISEVLAVLRGDRLATSQW